MKKNIRFETIAIHGGGPMDPATGAVVTPIYQTSTFKQSKIGEHKGFEYARTHNPTRQALERTLAALEMGSHGFAFSSGMAAIDSVLRLLKPGDHVLAMNDLYGGTYRLFQGIYSAYDIEFSYYPASNNQEFLKEVKPNTAMIWLETPTNPYLNISDIAMVASYVSSLKQRPLVCVDNTFATPYLQRPLALGADIVVHSTTKYLGGHSDLVGGAAITNNSKIAEKLAFVQNAVGAVPGPMDCFLVQRGLKTLALRMDQHAQNAKKVALYLADRPEISKVIYPDLETHPQYELAQRQMRNAGGIVSVIFKGGGAAGKLFAESTRYFTLAESLGAVESLIEIPAAMTHMSTADSPLAVDSALVRLSVGLEHVNDLIDDLAQALDKLGYSS